MKKLNKVCFICGAYCDDGIILNGEKICNKCENEIINTTILDKKYDSYENKIKVILFN